MYNGKVINFYSKQPMSGVQVTDGKNFTYTDENGCFSLEGWESAHVISVNMLTNSHDDWFINIDEHEGDFDFSLKPVECRDNFSFLHISDTEIEGRAVNDWMDFVRETVKQENPAFFINTGDLCRDDGVARTYLLMNTETAGCPVRFAIGNHDMCDGYGEKKYERYYGPSWYSFDCGQIHFVVLDIGAGDTKSGYTRQEREDWLKRDLSLADKSKGVIIFSHYFHPSPDGYGHTVEGTVEIAKASELIALIYGHDHYIYDYDYNNIKVICSSRPDSGGVDSSPAGIRKISVCKKEISSQYLYNIPPSHAYADKAIWKTKLDGNVEFSDVLEDNGAIWVCTNDDGFPKSCGIYKLDSESGKVLSFIETAGIKGTAQICDGRLYAQDLHGKLYCIDTQSSRLIWTAQSDIVCFTRSGVLIAENKVIAGKYSKLHAYNKDTGKLLWVTEIGGCETPAKLIYDNKRRQLIVMSHWLGVFAVSIDSGEKLWENKESPLCWHNTSTPSIKDDIIYKFGLTQAGTLNAVTGQTVTKHSTGLRADVSGKSVLDDELIYAPTTGTGVIALDANTFEIKKVFPCGNARLFTSPYVYGNLQTVETTPQLLDGKLFFGASDGYIYIYDKASTRLIRKIHVGSPVISTPFLGNGFIITADFEGNVKKFSI